MTRIDPVRATVTELSRAFGARTLSPVDAVEPLLERIRRRDPALPHRFSDYAAATGRIIGAEGYRFVGHLVDDESTDWRSAHE